MMAQNETQVKEEYIKEYIKGNWDWYLEQYQKRHWGYLLDEAAYILQQLGIVVARKPSIYEIKKEETFNKAIIYFNLYVGVWKISLKITDRGEVEAEVIR